MKNHIYSVALFFIFGVFSLGNIYAQDEPTLVDDSYYKSFKRINYQVLPVEIKKLMKVLKCGEIDAEPSQANGYTTNYDEGYTIDLNDDKALEYIFCCTAESHGPCWGNIYSLINGKWTVIATNFPVFNSGEPQKDIKLLTTKSNGFHDLFRKDSNIIMKFANGKYN